ncbi:hypothetical protein SUGI_1083270 [Cryptomeria japonica]|uniref:tRNA wybutosine-synthesizing protein 2/3/4 n=1 Tax=Cryptomeria japonica TaxID=3369 RepID=UPI0024149174|nr:tRNA wybutosine-synthesizing protein 2/3/4 [Cryptomeria japonica]GLJ50853.1 hypothetical protein SUGI_1083270 [Cryptomeria japonica]
MSRETCNLKWQKLPGHQSLKGRAGHSTTLVGNKLFIIGGRNGNEFCDDLWVFDSELEKWNQLKQKAPFTPRAYHTTTLIDNNYLWVIGGSNHDTLFDDVHVLNTSTLQWSCPIIKGTIGSRGTHAAVRHPLESRAILVHGGYGGPDPHWLEDILLLRTDSLEWYALNPGGKLPCARGYHSLTAIGAYVILFGGKGDSGIVKEDYMSVYDVVTNKWVIPEVEGDTPLPRSNHAATLMDTDLFIIHGGRNGTIRLSDMCVLKVPHSSSSSILTSRLKWHILEKMNSLVNTKKSAGKRSILNTESNFPLGRSAHSLIARGQSLYIFGGYGGQGLTFNDIYVLRNFPALAGLDQKNMNYLVSHDPKTPLLIADNSDEENVHYWRSTKRQKQHSSRGDKSVSRLQEVGRILKQGLDMTPRNRDAQDNIGIQLPKSLNRMQKQSSCVPQEQAILKEKEFAVIGQEKNMLEKEVMELRQQVESLKENIKEKTCIEDKLRADKLPLQEEVASLNEKRGDLAKIIKVLEKKVQLSTEKTKNIECENEGLKTQIKDLRSSLEEKESKTCGLAQEAKDAQLKCEKLNISLDNERSLYKELVHERDDYRTNMERLQTELEKKMEAIHQLNLKFENEKTFLKNEIAEGKETTNKLLTELGMTKESARALQETTEWQAKQLEDEKSKIHTLQKEREELRQRNAVSIAENKQILSARDSANLHFDFLKSELQDTRALQEQTTAEVIRLQRQIEQSKEHIASLHELLKKSEEAIKTKDQELVQLRVIINEVEQFEEAQKTKLQQHLEKLKCARQSCPL